MPYVARLAIARHVVIAVGLGLAVRNRAPSSQPAVRNRAPFAQPTVRNRALPLHLAMRNRAAIFF